MTGAIVVVVDVIVFVSIMICMQLSNGWSDSHECFPGLYLDQR